MRAEKGFCVCDEAPAQMVQPKTVKEEKMVCLHPLLDHDP